MLTDSDKRQFIENGYVYIRDAFAAEDAHAMCDFLWTQMPPEPDDPSTWTEATQHIEDSFDHGPFARMFSSRLLSAIDEVIGKDRYHVPEGVGWFAISFPGLDAPRPPEDRWWHLDIDAAGPIHVDLRQTDVRRQALVVIPVLSEIEPKGGGTLLAAGTHRTVARALHDAEPNGLDRSELREIALSARHDVHEVNGKPGDAVLTHSWLLHARGPNLGTRVRFMANPDITLKAPLVLDDPADTSLFTESIREALAERSRSA